MRMQSEIILNQLFILPDINGVHGEMELDWILANNIQSSALCYRSEAVAAGRYFKQVYFLEDFAPTKVRLAANTFRFLLVNLTTLLAIPSFQWKNAMGHVKEEIRVALSVHQCSKQHGFQNIYSFWAFNPVRNQILKTLNKNIHSITRAHRGDIYHFSDYIGQNHVWPWREKALRSYDMILSVSKEGTEYLKNQHGLRNARTVYLGSRSPKKTQLSGEQINGVNFVSVANIIPLKRLERIAGILRELETSVKWHHFGDARSAEFGQDLKSQISSLLADTPHRVIWHGRKKPEEIFQFYQIEQPQLFLSCSESEGIPVSVMEAMSCGIPVFTTDAGGSHELINGNGICVPIEFEPKNAANWIEQNIFEDQPLKAMRTASVTHWNNRFNFDQNQEKWLKILMGIKVLE